MRVTHYGQDYCYVTIKEKDYECPIAVGKAIDKLVKKFNDMAHREARLFEENLRLGGEETK